MTTETLNPIADLDLLSAPDVAAPVETALLIELELSPKKPSYGYDDEEEDDGYDDEEDEDDDEEGDEDEDDEYSYDDEDEDYEEDDEDEDDEDEDYDDEDEEEEDDDTGYYTRPLNSAYIM